jgi:predicted Fe-Mo cluster-binding NifX family protein
MVAMRIVITAKGDGSFAQFDPTFGRCGYFSLFDSEDGYIGSYENKAAEEPSGAGRAAARFVSGLGAKAIITGHLGPNASVAARQLGFDVYYGHFGHVQEAFSRMISGELAKAQL